MSVRKLAQGDNRELHRLARLLFGADDGVDPWNEQTFVFDRGDGRLGGFISVSRRAWTEGSAAKPVAQIEFWFVDSDLRRRGIGCKLMSAAEHWARRNGFIELCSDADLLNDVSLVAHQRMGFEPTVRLQYFRKPLIQAAKRVAGQG